MKKNITIIGIIILLLCIIFMVFRKPIVQHFKESTAPISKDQSSHKADIDSIKAAITAILQTKKIIDTAKWNKVIAYVRETNESFEMKTLNSILKKEINRNNTL